MHGDVSRNALKMELRVDVHVWIQSGKEKHRNCCAKSTVVYVVIFFVYRHLVYTAAVVDTSQACAFSPSSIFMRVSIRRRWEYLEHSLC